ncbi:hypothetical protein HanRHA438_Chr13g0602931 [Helianthus annuus]|uniref:Uncharacterized protein n=1 Tax=Helianthus annuus TaxID=4232 RepID=A0A9K3HC96_HELAN|nr:hypothetical protein HanXRQr2_Chr13g0592241 [Helianthus annuus]KAJ0477209.1 hypothetical protein HanHA300_Chr13g0485801 [Helianthus annuus]KAJ0481607.1 hypothetical protein HanIR_Chr13g0644451 [Helianthus annuus]KAJ0498043.1 hypothetical protein HanHA89_Chr13g0517941 [Helianthus annuus]KAJ0664042.1 hypothetical protein HanLR1_Chr13g0487771 [Helianthus annuus]
MAHNPSCGDLPHAPRWNLVQGSRMDSLENCHEFYSLSFPPAERLYQKNRNHFNLLDDHVQSGVNFFSTTQEIVREEAFNSEKKGLIWRVNDAEEKLSQEKQLNADRQKDWMTACERSNLELKATRDEVVKVKAERTKESQEYDHLSAAYKEKESKVLVAQKNNEEARARIAELEKMVAEQQAQNKTLDLLAKTWVMTIADRFVRSDELAKYMFDLGGAAYDSGRKDGYAEGKAAVLAKEKDDKFELYKVDCAGNYTAKRQEYKFIEFGILKAIKKLTRRGIAVETTMKVLEDNDAETGGAGSSHQP